MVAALNATLRELCGVNYVGLCDNARSADLSALLYNKLDNVTFKDPSGSNFVFSNKAHDRSYDIKVHKNGAYDHVSSIVL